MIPRDDITHWRERAPWSEDFQVEQDLVISRALLVMFSDPVLVGGVDFPGWLTSHDPDMTRCSTAFCTWIS